MSARLRQAVVAATNLEPVTERLRAALPLAEPYADPAVGAFGLRNAVFALGDSFLEVVSPTQPGTAAGRRLERLGGDCGYMVMFEVDDLARSRKAISGERVREVFEITLEDIAEVHLHPADIGGAIVALSEPHPPGSWRWGGPGWERRSAPLVVEGVTLAVAEPEAVAARWQAALGVDPGALGVRFTADPGDAGLVEVLLAGPEPVELDLGRVRVRVRVAPVGEGEV